MRDGQNKALDEFSKHWLKLLSQGKASSFNRLEWIAIEIYDKWLRDNGYFVVLKGNGKENPKTTPNNPICP